ncbi:mitotic-spindle organizing protein 2A [Trichonephila clavipes]|nr:mitotic-spindle organizing protein 2A [Trichonephila clavipes]
MACERKLLESEATTGFFVLLGTKGKKETLEWCMKANLIASRYECPRCKKEMRLQERKGTVDGYEWRCRSQSKDNPHDVVRIVRKGTWFSESKLAITIILRLTRYWFGKSMNAFLVNDDLTVTSWWMTIFMNSLHPSQGCIHQRNMTKCKRKVLKGHKGTINALVVDPEGKMLFSGGGDGIICCWNIANGELIRKMTGHENAVLSLIFIEIHEVLNSPSQMFPDMLD